MCAGLGLKVFLPKLSPSQPTPITHYFNLPRTPGQSAWGLPNTPLLVHFTPLRVLFFPTLLFFEPVTWPLGKKVTFIG